MRWWLIVLVAGLGCSDRASTAIDLQLVTDLNLNTEDQLVAWVRHVRIEIDSDAGLYTPDQARTTKSFSIENTDADPALELVIESPITNGRLPNVRVERGGLPEGALDVRVLGVDADGRHVASGGVSGVAFQPGAVQGLPVQFNLKSDYLPPRVNEIYPRPGEETCRAGVALMIFSKNLDPATVVPGGSVIVTRDDAPDALPLNLAVDGPIVRMVWGVLAPGPARYTITVTSDVHDLQGLGFDQEPANGGTQGFTSTFSVVDTPDCADYPYRWCHEASAQVECPDFRDGRLRCEDGVCVPHSCTGSTCDDGYVCDPVVAECVIDCRVYGGFEDCTSDTMVCDQDTGLCAPGDTPL